MSVAINLLPPEYRPRQSEPLSRGLLVAFIAGGVVLLIYLAFLGQMFLISRRVAMIEQQLAFYQSGASQAQASQKAISDWQQREKALQRLVSEERRWEPILKTINEALPGEVWLTGLEEDEGKGLLTLTGGSTSLGAVGDFLNNLQGSNLWQAVTLREVKGNGSSLNFTIQAVFKGAPGSRGNQVKPDTAGGPQSKTDGGQAGSGKAGNVP